MPETSSTEFLETVTGTAVEMRMLRFGRRWKWRCACCADVSDWFPTKRAMLQAATEHRLTWGHRFERRQRQGAVPNA